MSTRIPLCGGCGRPRLPEECFYGHDDIGPYLAHKCNIEKVHKIYLGVPQGDRPRGTHAAPVGQEAAGTPEYVGRHRREEP
jgi:hypothetical protein